jgi:hypothetical protein
MPMTATARSAAAVVSRLSRIPPDPLRGQLIQPGKYEGRRETDDQQQDDQFARPGRQPKQRSDYIGCLQNQPADGEVHHRNPEHVATLQLGEKRHMYPWIPVMAQAHADAAILAQPCARTYRNSARDLPAAATMRST